jgi:hypothetical protein
VARLYARQAVRASGFANAVKVEQTVRVEATPRRSA